MSSNLETVQLQLPLGKIKGVFRKTVYDEKYVSFEAIPYAKPPVGELRFKAPQPAEPWNFVRDCTNYAAKPLQKNFETGVIEGSEDCLYLNVYAKTLKSDKPLPVIVWIYGGGFFMGEATREQYSPDYFMKEEVLFISFNYRLCALGFLCLKDPELEIPGNAGLKDQVLALRWIQKYVSHFNGDPTNITVFGESAGGVSTHYMACTEQTRGLFQKFIPMSGVILNEFANTPQTDNGYRLAKQNGYTGTNNDKNVLDFLYTLDPSKYVDYDLLTTEEKRDGVAFSFGPTIEPYIGEDCVVPKSPIDMLRTAWSNNIPMMVGGTSFEGAIMFWHFSKYREVVDRFAEHPEQVVPLEVRKLLSPDESKILGQKLIRLHMGDKTPNNENIWDLLDIYSCRMFWHGIHRTVLSRLANASAPTYLYRFDFDSPTFNQYRKLICGDQLKSGVVHGDDLSYLFFSKLAWKLEPETPEYKTIQRMIDLWTSFAKTSIPKCSDLKSFKWPPLEKSNPYICLNISYDLEVKELPEKPKLDVWDSMYEKENLF